MACGQGAHASKARRRTSLVVLLLLLPLLLLRVDGAQRDSGACCCHALPLAAARPQQGRDAGLTTVHKPKSWLLTMVWLHSRAYDSRSLPLGVGGGRAADMGPRLDTDDRVDMLCAWCAQHSARE
jgi:hypothetical protein